MKNRHGLIFVVWLWSFFLLTSIVSAQDAFQTSQELQPFLIAQNSPALSDDLDQDLLEDYEETTDQPAITISDPLYYFNYFMYEVNDLLYFTVMKPAATSYKAVIPTPVRKGVRNFFHNLLFPVRFVNNLLQGEFGDAGKEVQIFLINSTIGVLGFGQVAQEEFDLHTANEDLGQTLGSYNIGDGFYLVLPVLGPSTLRDTLGRVGDYFITPVNYAEPWELNWGLKGLDGVNDISFRLGDYETLKKGAIDPYAAIKNAYLQNRQKKIEE